MIRTVVVLGAGNVAFHLTRAMLESTINVRQIYNRTLESAEEIARAHNIHFTDKISELEKADLYIIASADSAIEEISYHIPFDDCLVVHTSGSMPISTLRGDYRKGVFYPLQTFSKEKNIEYDEIPFFIEAENPEDAANLMQMADRISDKAYIMDSEKRMKMHLSAVFVNNFTNHLYALAEQFCEENEVPFDALHPLLQETTDKAMSMSPKLAQTGPAERKDQIVLEKHIQCIKDHKTQQLYTLLSESIQKLQND